MTTTDGDQADVQVAKDASVAEWDTSGRYYTYAEYLQLKLEGYYELIRGYLVKMPAPRDTHQMSLGVLHATAFTSFKGTSSIVRMAPWDVQLFPQREDTPRGKVNSVHTVVQPDLCVVCDPTKIDQRGCHGAPDLVVEVLSPGTAVKDRTTKVLLYEQAQVPEYWIVDTEARLIEKRTWMNGGYADQPECFIDGELVRSGRLPGFAVEVTAVLPPVSV